MTALYIPARAAPAPRAGLARARLQSTSLCATPPREDPKAAGGPLRAGVRARRAALRRLGRGGGCADFRPCTPAAHTPEPRFDMLHKPRLEY